MLAEKKQRGEVASTNVPLLETEMPDAKIRCFGGNVLSFRVQDFLHPLTVRRNSWEHLPSLTLYLESYGHPLVLLQLVFLTLLPFEEGLLASLWAPICLCSSSQVSPLSP